VRRYEHAHCLVGFIPKEHDSLLLIDTVIRLLNPLMGQSTQWGSLSSSTLSLYMVVGISWVSQFNGLTPSTHSLQIYDENIPSFAVSTLVSSD
jgi:hypothetical protein